MIIYDAVTANGIPYISRLYRGNFRYQMTVDDLDALKPARSSIMGGEGTVQSYSIGSRSLTRSQLSAQGVLDLWDKLMKDKELMEEGRRPRKAVAVVNRDW